MCPALTWCSNPGAIGSGCPNPGDLPTSIAFSDADREMSSPRRCSGPSASAEYDARVFKRSDSISSVLALLPFGWPHSKGG